MSAELIGPLVDQGIMYRGHELSVEEATAAAQEYLSALGWSDDRIQDALSPRRNLIARAWWGGEDLGMVQEHHDGAQSVTVVNVPPVPGA